MVHPSQAIRGLRSDRLDGQRIVLGVSGSIAAVEVPRIIRELIRHGADVHVVATPDALRIITEEALAFASGHPVVRELTGQVEHVTLLGPGEGQANLLLIAPATANTISKIAAGIDDTPVTSCASVALGGGVPILLAPAMHAHMGRNPAVAENLARLRQWGVGVIPSDSAEGEEKLASPEAIAAAVVHRLASGPWAGRSVVVIGGASREPIDEVRSITNESSGATAVALARQAHFRGADVELWTGGMQVPVPGYLVVRPWRSVADLTALARRESGALRRAAAVLVPAALADFTTTPEAGKIDSRARGAMHLELRPSRKVLPVLRALAPPPTRLVGFKLESGLDDSALAARAGRLAREAGLDAVVANGTENLGSAQATLLLVLPDGGRQALSGTKEEVAGRLLDHLGPRLAPTEGRGPPPVPARQGHRRRRRAMRR
jgi:phosphopantothenoylcysteine decarboxylase / phosphopantothenate---cysteine ligase